MKKLLALCLTTALAISITACSKPTESTATEGEQETQEEQPLTDGTAKILDYDKIVVGLDDTFAPMGFRDENGELAGLDVELAKAVSEQMGIPFELQPIDWSMSAKRSLAVI